MPTDFTGFEQAVGITATVSVYVVEIVIHLGLIIGFHMPVWAWLLLYSPAVGFGIANCIIGFSIYCHQIMAALGVNVLEGAWIFTSITPVASIAQARLRPRSHSMRPRPRPH